MKFFKLLPAILLFAASLVITSASRASVKNIITSYRVRTVPSSADQKKKEAGKVNQVKPAPSTGAVPCAQKSNQTKLLESSLWIGNGGKPK
jgi:hypothetical protein